MISDKLSMDIIRAMLKTKTDEEILSHFRALNYSIPATQDMIKRAKIKEGLLPRMGFKKPKTHCISSKDGIRIWHKPKEEGLSLFK